MAVTVSDIALVRKQVLEKLQASPDAARYTDAIGTTSEFTVLAEITDSALLIDQAVCSDIMTTAGHPYLNQFMGDSAEFDSGAEITAHMGTYGDVLIKVGSDWKPGKKAKSRDEVLAMIDNEVLYGGKSRFCYVENNVLYHCGDKGKIRFPSWAKTAACQSPQNYEDVLIYGTISISAKLDSDDPYFVRQDRLYQFCRSLVRARAEIIPPQAELEVAMRRS